MKRMVAFLGRHWTWIAGLISAVWSYAQPGAVQAIAREAQAHPVIGALCAAGVAFLAHISPTPLDRKLF